MDARRLHYFIEVANAGSFTAAAERLRIAQPALSKQVRLLEEDLGSSLLVRHGRGVVPTAVGSLLRERGDSVLRQLETLRDEITAEAEHPHGDVVLGTPPALRELLTLPVVCAFHARYPAVRLRLVQENAPLLRDQVAAGQLDLAIIPRFESDHGLDTRPLLQEALCIVGPAGRKWRLDRPVPLRTLSDLPLILTSHPNSFRRNVERILARAGVEPDVRLEADTLPLALELVAAFGYASVMPVSAVLNAVRRKQASAAPLAGQRVTWVLASLHARSRSSACRAMTEAIAEHCRVAVGPTRWPSAVLL